MNAIRIHTPHTALPLTALLAGAPLAALLASASAEAQSAAESESNWSASGNIALTSDYKFRGISQSNESPAVQGGFDLEHTSGFYIGLWGSTVDFDSTSEDFNGSLELDYYLGFSGDFGESEWAWDLGYLYYDYPGDDGAKGDYAEIYASLDWKDFSLGIAYSDDYYGETGDFRYLSADYNPALGGGFELSLHLGYNEVEQGGGFLSSRQSTYTDYSIGISKELLGILFGLAYTGTDLEDEDVFDTEWGSGTAVFSTSKSL